MSAEIFLQHEEEVLFFKVKVSSLILTYLLLQIHHVSVYMYIYVYVE